MKLKKSVKRKLIIFFILLVAGAGVFCYFKFFRQTNVARKVKIVDKIDKYGYQLRDTKNDAYKEEFKNLKKILIGKNGSMLKEIGTKARIDLEEYFNKKVFLSLYVKVIKNWRDRDNLINELGLKDDLSE